MVFDVPGAGFGQPLGWFGLGIFLLGSFAGLPLGNFLRTRLGDNRRLYRRAQAMILASKTRTEVTSDQSRTKDTPRLPKAVWLVKIRLPKFRGSIQFLLRVFFFFGVGFLFLWTWSGEFRSSFFEYGGTLHPKTLVDYLRFLFGNFEFQIVALGLGFLGFFWALFGPIIRGLTLGLYLGWIVVGASALAGSDGVIDYQVIGSPDVQPGLVISVSKDIDESANLPFRRVFLEGFRVSSGIQLLGFRPLYLSSYRIESGALVAEDPQIPWVFLLKPDPNSLPQVGYLLSSQAVEVFSWVSTQGMAEPFALRSGFLEVDPRVDTSIGLFGGSFSVLLPSTGR